MVNECEFKGCKKEWYYQLRVINSKFEIREGDYVRISDSAHLICLSCYNKYILNNLKKRS